MSKEPFAVGDKVNVVRTRHGWYDGQLTAQVTQRYQRPSGSWHYVVRDHDGEEHAVQHTRDMRPLG